MAALNRTFALAKANGVDEAIAEAEKMALTDNHFYFVLLAELYKDRDPEKARDYLQKALLTARTEPLKNIIKEKMKSDVDEKKAPAASNKRCL